VAAGGCSATAQALQPGQQSGAAIQIAPADSNGVVRYSAATTQADGLNGASRCVSGSVVSQLPTRQYTTDYIVGQQLDAGVVQWTGLPSSRLDPMPTLVNPHAGFQSDSSSTGARQVRPSSWTPAPVLDIADGRAPEMFLQGLRTAGGCLAQPMNQAPLGRPRAGSWVAAPPASAAPTVTVVQAPAITMDEWLQRNQQREEVAPTVPSLCAAEVRSYLQQEDRPKTPKVQADQQELSVTTQNLSALPTGLLQPLPTLTTSLPAPTITQVNSSPVTTSVGSTTIPVVSPEIGRPAASAGAVHTAATPTRARVESVTVLSAQAPGEKYVPPELPGKVQPLPGVEELSPQAVHEMLLQRGAGILVDVRGDDRASGLIEGSIHEPAVDTVPFVCKVPELAKRWASAPLVVFTCQFSQHRAPTCANDYREAADRQQRVAILHGGFRHWEAVGLPVKEFTKAASVAADDFALAQGLSFVQQRVA